MTACETCGNEYDKAFVVRMNGSDHTFDTFQCAIQALAPRCNHCGTRILGPGIEHEDQFYCCAHCAKKAGVPELKDRV